MYDPAVRRTPEEWCEQYGMVVLDPDGWRTSGAPAWTAPIGLSEFLERAKPSTTNGAATGAFARIEADLRAYVPGTGRAAGVNPAAAVQAVAGSARTNLIEVSSDLTPDGTYTVAISPTSDLSFALGRDLAMRYGLTVLTAVQYADYEAAIWRQMHAAGLGPAAAADVLTTLREKRRPLDHAATAPLAFEPILSAKTRAGMIRVLLDGTQIAQLEIPAAAEHAYAVLEMLPLVELDSLYYQWLRDVDVAELTARHTVGDLSRHHAGWLATRRTPPPETENP